MNAIETLISVLCDPEGKCCISGSDDDRRLIDSALAELAQAAQPTPAQADSVLYDPKAVLEIFNSARNGSDKPVGYMRGILAVIAHWESRPEPHRWMVPAQADTQPAPVLDYPPLPDPIEIDWPELHREALGCGVEDRNIQDRYEAAEYGWQDGADMAAGRVPEQIFTADQMRAYIDADRAARAPAYSVLKDHQIAALVNELRDIAIKFHGAQQLRERIAQVVVPALKATPADSVQEDAARWQMAVLVGDQVMVHPEKRTNPAAVKAYMDAVHSGLDLTSAIDAARKQGEKQ